MIIDNVLCFISYRLYLLCKSRRKCYVPACLFVYNCVFFDKNLSSTYKCNFLGADNKQ